MNTEDTRVYQQNLKDRFEHDMAQRRCNRYLPASVNIVLVVVRTIIVYDKYQILDVEASCTNRRGDLHIKYKKYSVDLTS
jgi:hypothetical protein